ncbi:MAG: type IV secretion system DNA-binding domain-containing protein [Candidatus Taylorbacteria bacterium]|nr:type IV secretion system DNA-binding domain-containing protein [Candidatus Taylorbacteria bacterium]
MNDDRVTYFAETDARNKRLKFGIKAKDRTRHVYVIGKTGMGKSTLLENMAVQDIQNGDGMAFIDPHGKTADLLLEYVPKERIRDVIYIAPFDTEFPISFNVLESVDPHKRHLVVSGLMSTFKKIWVDAWSARMEYILTNTLLALLEYPGSTLLGVNRMLSDKEYRKEVVSKIGDPSVKAFWTKEFAGYTERMAAEAVPAIQNKVGQFTANPLIRNMIGQPVSSFDFREAMDKRKIIIINLSKGKIGDENMKLMGGLLVTKIYLAAMSRADVPDRVAKLLPNFYLYVDEFQNFANASFADILSEARKYKLNLTIAHQYVEQMDEDVRAAVFGNVGTMITFRIGATDAEILEKEFAPQFMIEDLVNLGFTQIYLKLMIDGLTSTPFSAVTIAPIPHPETSFMQEIIAASREQFAKPREGVEVGIVKFHESVAKSTTAPAASGPKSTAVPSKPVSVNPPPGNLPPKQVLVPVPPSLASTLAKPILQKEVPHVVTSSNVPASTPPPISKFAQAPVLAPAPVAPVPAPKLEVKPVSLSSLAQKNLPKIDHKVPNQKNVDDLKSALAAALGSAVVPESIAKKPDVQSTTPAVPLASVSPAPVMTHRIIKPPINSPEEVPKEVLEKVLKVE